MIEPKPLSVLPASLMRNNFLKRLLGAPFHTLSKLHYLPVGFVTSLLIWGSVLLYFRPLKGGCHTTSDDLFSFYFDNCYALISSTLNWFTLILKPHNFHGMRFQLKLIFVNMGTSFYARIDKMMFISMHSPSLYRWTILMKKFLGTIHLSKFCADLLEIFFRDWYCNLTYDDFLQHNCDPSVFGTMLQNRAYCFTAYVLLTKISENPEEWIIYLEEIIIDFFFIFHFCFIVEHILIFVLIFT